MLKKVIKYVDYDGVQREETFYFNLSRAEVTELEVSRSGGLTGHIEKIVATEDKKEIVSLMKDLILMSIGEKSADGKRFVKSDEIRNNFVQSEAYTELFVELSTDADAAAEFVQRIVPQTVPDQPPTK